MKGLIRWFYIRYVFMPELRAFRHAREKSVYLRHQGIQLTNDVDILREILRYEDGLDRGPNLRAVH